ncbi:cbb3-type cytochrome c oxidase subunit 3 [Rhodosalinus sp. FB01]|uniref:cbb3-type cytochrome c oxidase subunit 3 n=1 Tax=Rhodosalinus sp. FB01 TaxID=3239194 RepID=UPI003525F346
METYSALRGFADSWGLLAMFVFFIAVVIWVFLPGRKKALEDSKTIPFRYEDAPAPDAGRDDDEPAENEEARK